MQGYCHNKWFKVSLGLIIVLVVCVENAYGQSKIQQVEVNPGESVRLNVFSEGATSYVWLRNDEIIDMATTSFLITDQAGMYSAIAYNDFECSSIMSNLVEVVVNATVPQYSVEHYCEWSKPTILEIDVGVEDIVWFSEKERQTSLPANTPLVDGVTYYGISATTAMDYEVQVFLDACLDIAVEKSVDAVEAAVGTQVSFTIVVSNVGNITGENLVIKEQLPDGYSYQDHQLSLGHYSSVSGLWELPELAPNSSEELKLRTRLKEGRNYVNTAALVYSEPEDFMIDNNVANAQVEPTCVRVFDIFTPNHDGNNDTFVIQCIEKYPNNTLKVFDKDGSLVYSKYGYDNSWNGYSNSKWALNRSKPLPAGVYFYILDLGNDTKTMTGWIFIGY